MTAVVNALTNKGRQEKTLSQFVVPHAEGKQTSTIKKFAVRLSKVMKLILNVKNQLKVTKDVLNFPIREEKTVPKPCANLLYAV